MTSTSQSPSPQTGGLDYIPALDGMRALSILLVLFFHLDWKLFQGGFIGVDVFFVISGYIITRQILRQQESGTFSLSAFWLRRIARLMPALLVTVIATLAAAYLLLSPSDYVRLSQVAISNLFYVSNFFFYFESGYFDSSAASKPLLHTWSLSVEEQFYIIWPLILMLAFWVGARRGVVIGIILVSVLSFGLAAATHHQGHSAFAFFMMPARMFQFGFGALAAIALPQLTGSKANIAAVLSIVGLVACAAIPGLQTSNIFILALLPTLLATLLLLSMEGSVGKALLGNSWATYLGKRAYSIYLVHWPIFVFFFWFYSRGPRILDDLALFAAAIILGIALYELVERRFRLSGEMPARSKRLRLAGVAGLVGLMAASSSVVTIAEGFPDRVPRQVLAMKKNLRLAKSELRKAARFRECFFFRGKNDKWAKKALESISSCVQTVPNKLNVLIVGDSAGNAIYVGMKAFQDEMGVNVEYIGYAGCWPVSYDEIGDIKGCADYHKKRVQQAMDSEFDIIVLASNWSWESIDGLAAQIQEFRKKKKVVVIGMTPRFELPPFRLFDRYQDQETLERKAFEHLKPSYNVVISENARVKSITEQEGAVFIDVFKDLCNPENCPVFTSDHKRRILYYDDYHMTVPGSLRLGKLIKEGWAKSSIVPSLASN